MWNIFKKSDSSKRDVGGGTGSSFVPPKNLPDLSRDIYEAEKLKSTKVSEEKTQSSQVKSIVHEQSIIPIQSKVLSEPDKNSVPQLDLSLIREQLASQPDYKQVFNSDIQQSFRNSATRIPLYEEKLPVQQSVTPQINTPQNVQVTQQSILQTSNPQSIPQSPLPQISQSTPLTSFQGGFNANLSNATVFTGFFREFEEYVRSNGLSNDVIDGLLDKNLLERMVFYHSAKGGGVPFYASSAELSHAIKVKLEDLQNLEHNWTVNTQKLDLLKRFGGTIESDIYLLSEELKKLMMESRRRESPMRSADFFNILKMKNGSEGANPDSTHSISSDSSGSSPNNNSPNTFSNDLTRAQVEASLHTLQPPEALKYSLNRYNIYDSTKYFYARNGQVFKSLSDLIDGLEIIDRETFEYHANINKNDFSNWIKGVFNDLRLSDAIRSLITREDLWRFLKNNTH